LGFVSLAASNEHYGSAISPLAWKNEDEAERSFSSCLKASTLSNFSTMPWRYRIREMNGEHEMPLSTVLITLVAAGLLLWIVNRFIPMQSQVKSILNGLVVVVLVLWIANLYGVFDHLHQFRVGRR
jgi:ABC-type Co2+ transport system permease subunit